MSQNSHRTKEVSVDFDVYDYAPSMDIRSSPCHVTGREATRCLLNIRRGEKIHVFFAPWAETRKIDENPILARGLPRYLHVP